MNQATIALIDDDPVFLELIERMLRRRGHRVVTALNGQEGLELCLRELPALVITGIIMPVMRGWELCRRLRQNGALQHVPILVMSGCAAPDQVAAHYAAGANAFLPKPFSQLAFSAIVTQLLGETEFPRSSEPLRT